MERGRRATAGAGAAVLAAGLLLTVAPNAGATGEPIQMGFIGMTLEGTDSLVNQAGIEGWSFQDEVATANALVPELQAQGVEAIVVLLHEGGVQGGGISDCVGMSGPIVDIAQNLDPAIDLVVTGHTHEAYICDIPDPEGKSRYVTSAESFGRLITETNMIVDPETRDVVRGSVTAVNHIVTQDVDPDPEATELLNKWEPLAEAEGSRPVGTATADITRGFTNSSEDRGIESDLSNLIADAQLWATSGARGDADLALMNAGGVRADLSAGPITYEDAFNVQPFANILQTITLTGAQIDQVLEEQWNSDRLGARYRQHLGVSTGFEYTYDEKQPEGSRVDPATITLNGNPLDPAAQYRVTVSQFLAGGGDDFFTLAEGTDVTGAGQDLEEFTAYLTATEPTDPPGTDRVTEIMCFDSAGTALPGAPAGCPSDPTSSSRQANPQGQSGSTDGAPDGGADAEALDPVAATEAEGMEVQILSFNDFHGHIQSDTPGDIDDVDAGGAEYLSAHLQMLREGHDTTYTVAAGDIIGGSTFISGLFHDEPSVEAMGIAGLDVAGVGNHEFDEGVDELLRMQNGGCHPVDGCYFPDEPYAGAEFQYTAANVTNDADGSTPLPPYSIVTLAEAPPQLPDTGSSSWLITTVGLGLAATGAVLLAMARRSRTS